MSEASKARGEALKAIRLEKGLQLKPAAEIGEISKSTLQSLESGYTEDPGISYIAKINRIYGIPTSKILDLFGITVEHDESLQERVEQLEEVATGVLVAIWRAVQVGQLDERSAIADQALRLRDALNPDWPNNPDWLPEELQG